MATELGPERLVERVQFLERQNRRFKKVGVAVLLTTLLLIVLFAGSSDVHKNVDATSFRVRDAEGNVRAVMGVGSSGLPLLAMLDKKGDAKITVGLMEDGRSELRLSAKNTIRLWTNLDGSAEFSLLDSDQRSGIRLSSWAEGTTIVLSNDLGEKAVEIGTWHDHQVGINLYKRGGTARMMMAVLPEGDATLAIYDHREKNRARIRVSADSQPDLCFFDANEAPRALAFLTAEGEPVVKVYGQDGKARTVYPQE